MTDWSFPAAAAWAPPGTRETACELDAALGAARAGMRFFLGDMPELLDLLRSAPAGGRMITVCNVHMLVAAGRDRALARAMRGAAFSLCDGQPVAWLLSLLTGGRVPRITGPDLLAAMLAAPGLRVALVGGGEAVLARLARDLPEARRGDVLMIAPGHVAEGEGPSPEILAALSAFGPRFVLVGLGCPKQEKWMARAVAELPATFVGVGAAFDYAAGGISRAPRALQAAGGEWLWRLAQQPRLLRRYAGTILPFLGILALGLRAAALRRPRAPLPRRL
ncbi:WecB/TagA/CpsF family glycosyltransferase [Amaricoccus solimangrovi]|uniref:WecB/TagA/CpsF family glycosyltransferase n=1 Tax=Amaricoccus solimangrovi TaxID=2589815 RepID=A0A501WRJ7_9RHOB|nr:WecB/TagA/CpsF family glycosyltransferase [Amaricoccus solimangrovi]TPE49907.1 WecB/TagA/CpsF family glycosyltransferase [Amaricoccus solimangrovi]